MNYSIHQVSPTQWELRSSDGSVVASFEDSPGANGYELALAHLGELISVELASGDSGDDGATEGVNGLLAERWIDKDGIAFSRVLDGGRDFTNCAWSWRDPKASLVPLMLLDENTSYGHLGARLAGFVEEFSLADGTVHSAGRFYDTEVGRQFRDYLLDGRIFGVSVDPSEKVDAEFHEECIEQDEDGFCIDYEFSIIFTAYEIAGLTGCPIPGFEEAAIQLDTAAAASSSSSASAQPVRAALSIPVKPPKQWLTLAEPKPGQAFLDTDGDKVLVPQLDRDGNVVSLACPLTIEDNGLVYGHLTWWGQCHVGEPWGPGMCASASPSKNGYADFYGSGEVVCADGSKLPAGVLTVGCEHSSYFTPGEVRDHMAHAGVGWASVRIVDGEYGPWVCGVLRPDLTETQVAVLRRLSLSGEWVGELGGILSVNAPGLPVQRALAASAFGGGSSFTIAKPVRGSAMRGGAVARLIGGNIVSRCKDCEQRAALGLDSVGSSRELLRLVRELVSGQRVIERRTRHLTVAEAAATALRIGAGK